MPQVVVTIAGRSYRMNCDAGEEALERRLRVDLEGEELPSPWQARQPHGDGLASASVRENPFSQ